MQTHRMWRPRPNRRWGWVSDDGYEIEWRRAEADEPAGYFLFGPGIFGRRINRTEKATIQAEADFVINMRSAGFDA
jgi:hypothetical protein